MVKHDKKARRLNDQKFVKLDWWLLESEAYRALTCPARCLLVELYSLYNGRNNGELFLSVRDAAAKINVGKNRAGAALKELEQKGFIRVNQKGSFDWKCRHATTWILSAFEHKGNSATKDFLRWKP